MRHLRALALLLFATMAGCLDSRLPSDAILVDATILSTGGTAYQLVLDYYDAASHSIITVYNPGDEITTVKLETLDGFVFVPLDESGFSSPAKAQRFVDQLTQLVPVGSTAYAEFRLEASSGKPTWTVGQYEGRARTQSTVDDATMTVVQSAGMSFQEAFAEARKRPAAWCKDAVMYSAAGVERSYDGRFAETGMQNDGAMPLFIPPDAVATDGVASIWEFLSYCPSEHRIRSIVVYPGLGTFMNEPRPPRDRAREYTTGWFETIEADSTAGAGLVGPEFEGLPVAKYAFYKTSSGYHVVWDWGCDAMLVEPKTGNVTWSQWSDCLGGRSTGP